MSDISSTSSSSANASDLAAGQANLTSSYSTFLTLLTTQLQNQDPTSPMDTNAFTQQLVAMTGVQQQLLTNNLLEQMVSNSATGSVASSVNLIGQNVTAITSSATLTSGSATWNYTMPSTAASGWATVSDSSGATVWSGAVSQLSAGNDTFTWNGENQSGVQQSNGGAYSLSISATDSSGNAVTPTLYTTGVVNSLQSVNGVAEATIGTTQVPISSITSVTGS